MQTLRFILQSANSYRSYLWGIFFAIFLIAIDANLRPYLVKELINTAVTPGSSNIWGLVCIYAVSQFLMVLAWRLSDWCASTFNGYYRTNLAASLASKVSAYSYSFFQNNLSGSIVAKINDAFSLTLNIIFTAQYQFVQFFLTALITLVLLAQVHIFFTLALLLWMIVFSLMTIFGIKKVTPLMKRYAQSKSKIFGHLADYFTNMLNAKLFAASDFEMNRLHDVSGDYIESTKKQGYFLMNFYFVQGIIVSVYTLGFLFFLIHLQNQKVITPGDFALVFMLNLRMFEKLFELSHQLREFTVNWGAVDQALDMLKGIPEITDIPNAKSLKVPKGQIIFDKVRFHYKGTEPLFNDLSISIEPGQKVGLVGYSGGGKSTFVNLILRLYDCSSGHISIDDQDIKHVTQDSLRRHIGMIPQDPSLFHRSLMDNIRYGDIDASDAEVMQAAKRAHAHEFISKLARGYESLVGERGVKLSGGQRQRIAIARAMLKNAPILILDEATSQLDSLTENDIQDSLWELMDQKTAIVIAHRLSTLLHMDRILVFDNGAIVEDGTHQKLLSKNTLYKTLWDAQVGGFLPDKESKNL